MNSSGCLCRLQGSAQLRFGVEKEVGTGRNTFPFTNPRQDDDPAGATKSDLDIARLEGPGLELDEDHLPQSGVDHRVLRDGNAIARLALDAATRDQLAANVAVPVAVAYLVGLITAVWVLSVLGPKLMRVDLAAACHALEKKMGVVTAEPGVLSAYTQHGVRDYRVTRELAGRTVRQLEELFGGERVFVERVVCILDLCRILTAGLVVF